MMFSYDEMNPLSEKRQLLRVKSSTERILCNKIPITVREKKEEKTAEEKLEELEIENEIARIKSEKGIKV